MGTGEHRAAAGPGELHVIFGLGHWIVRDRRKPLGGAIGAGKDAEYTGYGFCRRDIDRNDARMRMRRAHHRRMGLTVEIEIVAEAALAGDEPLVLLTWQRLTDEAIRALRRCLVVHRVSLVGFAIL